ncbi:S-layer homology domain-containing protein [Paenibacillus sedimenti]|uniref:S-layer homology domain-containing protein n=1 Tax=Paenibacillus sedimenti TaxID=2770274 RepID=A0A926QIQ6_9BACL|nr:S-layer homology domain-containing protein [Paenibacillus sedimenti]MBD0379587.1 S-layer homology domain-containing protein [Paenibacillus sedimenti]
MRDPKQINLDLLKDNGETVTLTTYNYNTVSPRYDNQNRPFNTVTFDETIGFAPTKLTIRDEDASRDIISYPNITDATRIGYSFANNLELGIYRMKGSHHFSTVTASTYLSAGAKLFTFTPQQHALPAYSAVPLKGMYFYLPSSGGDFVALKKENTEESDFIVTDKTLGQNVPLTYAGPSRSGSVTQIVYSSYVMLIQPQTPFQVDHEYELSLSSTSSGNEILMPAPGKYTVSALLGDIYTGSSYPFLTNYVNSINFFYTEIGQSASTTTPTESGSEQSNGGEGTTPSASGPVAGTTGNTSTTGNAEPTKADKLLQEMAAAKDSMVTLSVPDFKDSADIRFSGQALSDALAKAPNGKIAIQSEQIGYELPIRILNLPSLIDALGVKKPEEIQFTVHLNKTATLPELAKSFSEHGLQSISDTYSFEVFAEANGKKVEVNSFSDTYVSRYVQLNGSINKNEASVVMIDPVTKAYSFVPALFVTENGKTIVTIKRNGNSEYTVVSGKKSFNDLNNHWSQADVELLATKLIVNGTSDSQFTPDQQITRAQFTALLVRGLGLKDENISPEFKDVKASDWFAGAVSTGVKVGLVSGYENNTFSPEAPITRQEMAVMLSRAAKFAGQPITLKSTSSDLLNGFKDREKIQAWALNEIAEAVQAGFVRGMGDSGFVPGEKATRAQAAVTVKRLLDYLKFIN